MDIETKLDQLFEELGSKSYDSLSHEEKIFYDVWDWSTLICLGGFEKLFENEVNIDDCIKKFGEVGLKETIIIFERVKTHIKPELSEDEQWDYFDEHFEELKELTHQYYEITTPSICQTINDYIENKKIRT